MPAMTQRMPAAEREGEAEEAEESDIIGGKAAARGDTAERAQARRKNERQAPKGWPTAA